MSKMKKRYLCERIEYKTNLRTIFTIINAESKEKAEDIFREKDPSSGYTAYSYKVKYIGKEKIK